MNWSSALLAVLIVALFDSGFKADSEINCLNCYNVTPSGIIGCVNDQVPCQSMEQYATQPERYFANNTCFCFQPGNHQLNSSLKLSNLRNVVFKGLPNSSNMVNIFLGPFVNITWEDCWFIQVTSINFIFPENYSFSIVFKRTQLIELYNISVTANGQNTGCSAILSQQSGISIRNCRFIGIQGSFGAAIMMSESSAVTTGNNTFANCTAYTGGSVYLSNSALTLNGTNIFMNNTASVPFFSDFISMHIIDAICNHGTENYPKMRLTMYMARAHGGAILCDNCTLTINEYSTFKRNNAERYGGAVAGLHGGISIHDSTLFDGNSADVGGAMNLEDINLAISGNVSLANNIAAYGGALHVSDTNISFNMDATVTSESNVSEILVDGSSSMVVFQQNIASQVGGAIESHANNILIFTGTVKFIDNSALNGGAIGFLRDLPTRMILIPVLSIFFIMNHANDSGGALYFEDSQCILESNSPECFISIVNRSSYPNPILIFEHNSAGSAGSTVYGGHLSECRLYYRTKIHHSVCDDKYYDYNYTDDALEVFMNLSRIINYKESDTNISSPARNIKLCEKLQYGQHIHVYPGEQFSIVLKAISQGSSLVPANILIDNSYTGGYYSITPLSQNIDASCTQVYFRLYSHEEGRFVQLGLFPENLCQSLIRSLEIGIHINPCPSGFEISQDYKKCICHKKIQKFTPNCYIDDLSIERTRNNFWIAQTDIKSELIIYESRCPHEYCIENSINVTFMFSDLSTQCDFNRNGTLCGQCQKNFSLALGSLHCIPCDNGHIALIVLFFLAGMILIVIIYSIRLTVAVGTINGLLFYANIVQANNNAYFSRSKINFFTIFISWLNLDLGIETCFYDGMDIYSYSWFQFLFPFYVWFLVSSIILASRYSQTIAKRFGQNPVAILSTLLLMSYSKMLQAIIVPLSFTYLTYYNTSNDSEIHRTIWKYDGSIGFFKESKHTALALFSILSLVVFVVPYISLLFCGHWLQGCSNWWILSWLNKIKPFMDAYHAPFRKHTRYWTGLLLITRLGLFLTFTINGNESANLVAVCSVSIALFAIQRRVYEYWLKDILESSFILNLGIFSVATFYLKEVSDSQDDKIQRILSSVSVGIAFITFLGILLFHISLVLKSSNIWKIYMLSFIQKSLLLSRILRITPVKDQTRAGDKDAAELQALPTSTEIDVDLREPLLDITESQAIA